MVIEYSRNVLNLKDANSSEFDQNSKNHVIDFLPGQIKLKETGASMRLGNYPCVIDKNLKFLVVTTIMKLLKGTDIDMKLTMTIGQS